MYIFHIEKYPKYEVNIADMAKNTKQPINQTKYKGKSNTLLNVINII